MTGAPRSGALVPVAFALAALAFAIWFFPVDCDGAFAIYDGLSYGLGADRGEAKSISPHHPLFHVLALGLVPPLRAFGIDGPGHVAVRILSGLGAAWLLLQICRLAGPQRPLAGAAFALPLLASGGFLVEAAAGETVLPGVAAGLFALTLAARPGARLVPTGAALAFAVLLRQDNVLLVPGVSVALALAQPRGARVAAVVQVLAGAGLATAAGYLAAWIAGTGARMPLLQWMFWLARLEGFATHALEWSDFSRWFASFANAIAGPFWLAPDARWTAAGLAASAAAALLLRGTSPHLRLFVPIAITVAVGAAFDAWWLPSSFEYCVATAAFLAAAFATLARGEPATPLFSRRAAAVLMIGLTAGILFLHGRGTLRLRERRLSEVVSDTVELGRGEARFVTIDHKTGIALDRLGLRDTAIHGGGAIEAIIERITREARTSPVRTIVIADRFSLDPTPAGEDESRQSMPIDSATAPPGVRFLVRKGLVYGAVFPPGMPESGPASR